jgi:hypothetical protein
MSLNHDLIQSFTGFKHRIALGLCLQFFNIGFDLGRDGFEICEGRCKLQPRSPNLIAIFMIAPVVQVLSVADRQHQNLGIGYMKARWLVFGSLCRRRSLPACNCINHK